MITRNLIAFLLFLLLTQCLTAQPEVHLIEYKSGFTKPVDIANAGDARLFIVEQAGKIKIIDSTGTTLTTPFLDIQSRVKSAASEQGLLGLAFHPDYKSNGYFFVNYIGLADSTHISRFKVSGNLNVGDPSSEEKIMSIAQPFLNHNGGCLRFGPDGFLYIGTGDGGSAGDPGNRAQDSAQLLGKMLRIDVDVLPYSVPSSNPFVGVSGIHPEIWALGLRNPWRFSFDTQSGNLWIGDVGQSTWEEVDYQEASSSGGENYGWRCYEGPSAYNSSGCLPSSNYTLPIHQYDNSGFGGDCSITGGAVYRGSDSPNIDGYYFFADYCSSKLWSLHDSAGIWVNSYHGKFSGNWFSAFGLDYDGELYVAGIQSGKVFKIADSSEVVGIQEETESVGSTYPNPFTDFVSVELTENKTTRYSVLSLTGKIEDEGYLNESHQINLSFLERGLYFLRLEQSEKVTVLRILKN